MEMATISDEALRQRGFPDAERNFFRVMAVVMAMVIVAGFTLNLAMGRSTFAVPVVYHVHALVFFGWVALYVAQNWLIAGNHVALHWKLGLLAYGWVPVMVVLGFAIMLTSLRRTGGPFFFDQSEFLFSNSMLLLLFGAMAMTALRRRRHMGWHRRLMMTAMAILTGPGLGRLLPMPLFIPHAWRIGILATLIFPVIGMIADKRRHGHVHAAWFWGVGAIVLTQLLADVIAYSGFGIGITHALLEGTPGSARPIEAFLPPAFGS
ncbi:hypothetical protein M527_06190 [Sphingobium indicum IP26]|nr:hypothetical protein M527_06190 [Sphingobium indicum IP26]EQB04904.1 hypothetical protein L286_09030 [Sphingobium sp. HDIP04]